ncbi:hypothetical protein EMN47_08085 [Prolixibacteraceae bacterium JC049]|nr:hypothetical protein [Prolixibacteraceae bacterium JC049]
MKKVVYFIVLCLFVVSACSESNEPQQEDQTPTISTTDVPAFEPDVWNDGKSGWRRNTKQSQNNCYAYAVNTFNRSDRDACPGGSQGRYWTEVCGSLEGIIAAAETDGLKRLTGDEEPEEGWTKVALFVARYADDSARIRDMHWYRRDNNNMWSHKPGESEARNTDDAGELISNPENALSNTHPEFVTYMSVKSAVEQGQGSTNINGQDNGSADD